MAIRHRLLATSLILLLFPSLALGNGFNKFNPLSTDLRQYTGEKIFDSAYQAYICSFMMHLAGQQKKAQFLRWYSTKLMQNDKVKSHGKNWNDVNFPGGLSATLLARKIAAQFNISKSAAAEKILTEDPQCKNFNNFSVKDLKRR